MAEKKYKMIPEGNMFRIEALRNFGDVKKGDKGGLIENEGNLSHVGNCWVYGAAEIFGEAKVYDNAMIYGNAIVCDKAVVCGNAQVYGNAGVCDNAAVCDNALICGNAKVRNNARVHGAAMICRNAEISSEADYIVFKNWWSSGRYFTWTKSNNMWRVGCFFGSGEELIKKAYSDSEEKGKEYERVVRYVESFTKKL